MKWADWPLARLSVGLVLLASAAGAEVEVNEANRLRWLLRPDVGLQKAMSPYSSSGEVEVGWRQVGFLSKTPGVVKTLGATGEDLAVLAPTEAGNLLFPDQLPHALEQII